MYLVFATLTISNIAASSIHHWLSLVTRLSLLQIPKVATWEPVPEDQLPPVILLTQHHTVQSWLNVWKSTVDVRYLADRFQSFIFRILAIEHLPNVSLVDSGQIAQFFFSVSYLLPWGFRVLYDIITMSYKISLVKLCSSDRQLNSSKRKITWWKNLVIKVGWE